jgi:predicted nucleic acid-binding protein
MNSLSNSVDLPAAAVLDSNWIIGVLRTTETPPPVSIYSSISKLEVLGYPLISPLEDVDARLLFAQSWEAPVTEAEIETAVRLRREYGGKTVDAIIAATALNLRIPLLTRDRDFLRYRLVVEVIGMS